MADEPTPTEAQEPENAKADDKEPQGPDWKAEARKWEKRAKANAKELEDMRAAQSDDANAHIAEELEKARQEVKALKAEKERSGLVRSIAKTSGVDPDILIKMAGDSEDEIKENASLLARSSKAKWPTVPDEGSPKGNSSKMTKEQILAIRNPVEQLHAAARNLDAFK